ncbi:MAG: class I SAM-dependent methyltransferase [Granulosicoccus sp.]|nr:class I SAM-dependent methyltransferase [Granulosicoccus sp.]
MCEQHETEEILSRNWLNQRQPHDDKARNQTLLKRVIDLLKSSALGKETAPVVADLGSGTGNNVLYLQKHLSTDTHYQLIEQHQFLLEESRRRLGSLSADFNSRVTFYQSNIDSWLGTQPTDLLTNSALLDLFTETELRSLLLHIETLKTPMYSSLNYRAVRFFPNDPDDNLYIQLFEQHMSRELDRGRPLGAATCATLERLIRRSNRLQLFAGHSDWLVPATDSEFISTNIDFYEKGIGDIITGTQQQHSLDQWISNKRRLIDKHALSLTVQHKDYLIMPY